MQHKSKMQQHLVLCKNVFMRHYRFNSLIRFTIQSSPVNKVCFFRSFQRIESVDEIHFPVVPFIMLYTGKMILPFESVDEILKCDHSNEIYMYLAVLSTGAVCNLGLHCTWCSYFRVI